MNKLYGSIPGTQLCAQGPCDSVKVPTLQPRFHSTAQPVVRWHINLWQKFQAYLKLLNTRRIERAAFEQLLKLDDSTLSDIGVSKADVIWASKLPLSQDASKELELIARKYKQHY